MNSFELTYNESTFKFTLNKSGSFPKLQIEISKNNVCYYKSKEIIITKYVIEEIIELIKTGNPSLEVSRFEFRDPDKSFLLFIDGETILIGQTHNLISRRREEFVIKYINKTELLGFLENVNA